MNLLWADLINSDWHDYRGGGGREDRINNDAWLASFLARCGWAGGRLPGTDGREALRRLRALLRRLALGLMATGTASRRNLLGFKRTLAGATVVRRLEGGDGHWSVSLVPTSGDLGHAMGEIANSFATLLVEGDPSRIKICANSDCGWVIYDESRNRTRRWCEATECGNLIKVRRFRSRRRQARQPAAP